MTDPLVSIITFTYNHEKFIAKAIEGFLIQKTSFPIEVLINEDASTDGTAAIVRKYEAEHPEIIKGFYQAENQYSKGENPTAFYLSIAKGKYIALCDGDDYWTDPLKLQKQVDFLKEHQDISACYHPAYQLFEKTGKFKGIIGRRTGGVYSFDETLYMQGLPLCSLMFRRNLIPNPIPSWFYNVSAGDQALFFMLAKQGRIAFLENVSAVYRYHSQGIWSNTSFLTQLEKSHQTRKIIYSNLLADNPELLAKMLRWNNSHVAKLSMRHFMRIIRKKEKERLYPYIKFALQYDLIETFFTFGAGLLQKIKLQRPRY